ncbi:MAG: hypothetical protein KGM47_03115 [Acidobacteriota bacterium]|nr:hypothetical protein [Acidobacteriota bacterium]
MLSFVDNMKAPATRRAGGASSSLKASTSRGDSGRGYLSLIITLIILAGAAYTGVQVVPVYVSNFRLNDYLTTLAQEVAVKHIEMADAPAAVVSKAADLALPVQPGDVEAGNGINSVKISVNYSVPIDLKIYTWTLHFSDSASAPSTVY